MDDTKLHFICFAHQTIPVTFPFNSTEQLSDICMRYQLQDLRRMIARMLAVDTSCRTVPDYEIISRLEKLILATQANSSSTPGMMVPLDGIMDQLSDEFRSGYCSAGRVLSDLPQPRSPATPNPGRSRPGHRRLDSKVY